MKKTQTQSLKLTEHQPGDWQVVTEPSVDSSGTVIPGKRVRTCTVRGQEIVSEEITLSAEEIAAQYKASCQPLTFEQVARNPDTYDGTKAMFTGEVIQVMEESGFYTLRVNVTPTSWGYTDTIMVGYQASSGEPRILEGDIITMYGTIYLRILYGRKHHCFTA